MVNPFYVLFLAVFSVFIIGYLLGDTLAATACMNAITGK